MKIPMTFFLSIVISNGLLCQSTDNKLKAFEAFDDKNYPLAIAFMHKALEENPNDKEIYYYLGYYYHYSAYDSRPLIGYNSHYSDTVFYYLEKALELDPNYGDAKYFYTAECGGAVSQAMKEKDYGRIKYFYQKAANIGGFPDWLTEYGRLMLSQVEPNGILFTMGDLTLNVCRYLQVCEEYRTDITVLAWGLLNRPYYILELKNGKSRKNLKIDLSEEQIMDMHPYKWDTTIIKIDVPENICSRFGLEEDYKMGWEIAPDLFGGRSYLSCETAIILSIIESNHWERSVFIQTGMAEYIIPGIHRNLTMFGLVEKLVPFNTENTPWRNNVESLENFIQSGSLKDYSSIVETNQPRVSGTVLYSYYQSLYYLAMHYLQSDEPSRIGDIIGFYKEHLELGVIPDYEEGLLKELEKMRD